MASSLKSVIKSYLPLLLGPMVLIAMFTLTDLSWNDREIDARVESVDIVAGTVKVSGADGSTHALALSEVAIYREGGEFHANPEASVEKQRRFTLKGIASRVANVGLFNVLAVVGLTVLALMVQAWRLAALYSCGGHVAKWRHAFRALLIGLLYGNVLPAGQVGGDPIKAFYLARLSGGRRSHALAAALIDRAIGLAVLAAIAGVAIVAGVVEFSDARIRYAVLVFLVVGLLATCALLSSRLRARLGISALVSRLPMAGVRDKMSAALKEVSASPTTLILAVGLSIVAHILLIAAVFVVALALGLGLSFLEFVAKVPVANIVASLPLAPPGGWGVGEWAYLLLFAEVGAGAAFTLSALPRLAMLFVSLWGVLASWHLPSREEVGKETAIIMPEEVPGEEQ